MPQGSLFEPEIISEMIFVKGIYFCYFLIQLTLNLNSLAPFR